MAERLLTETLVDCEKFILLNIYCPNSTTAFSALIWKKYCLTKVLNCRKKGIFELPNIGNMGETLVWLDMPLAKTVNVWGEKTVTTATTGYEKSRFTVIFSCLADGHYHLWAKDPAKKTFPSGWVMASFLSATPSSAIFGIDSSLFFWLCHLPPTYAGLVKK